MKKPRTIAIRGQLLPELISFQLLCPLNCVRAEASGADMHCFGSSINHYLDGPNVGLLSGQSPARNLGTGYPDLSSKKHIFLTDITFCHPVHLLAFLLNAQVKAYHKSLEKASKTRAPCCQSGYFFCSLFISRVVNPGLPFSSRPSIKPFHIVLVGQTLMQSPQ